nr:amino acid permease [Clostridia bacterium]
MEQLKKKYGLFTAICMVVGIVIGSGVFFKAQDVLKETNGNALDGILAWIIGGAIMIVFASTFAVMATKYEKVNGMVDYAEALCGKTYAYFVGWFISMIYYPAMTGVLAWVSARYTIVAVFGESSVSERALMGPECIAIAALYLILMYFINTIAPRLAGRVQVSTTVIKFIPLVFIALVGTIIGLANGTLVDNFQIGDKIKDALTITGQPLGNSMFAAICCTAFAYEGWIVATSINAEIKNSKRNLPIALFIGAIIIALTYILYYIGVLGLGETEVLMTQGTTTAFNFFGPAVATIINFLIIISCLGTLNGLMVASTRGVYSLAARGEGISPKTFANIDKSTNMPHNSAALGLLLCGFWMAYFIGGQFFDWFGKYAFDSSELPIITIYPIYVPILVSFMLKEKGLNPFFRFVLPSLSIIGAGIMVAASIFRHKISNVWYLILFTLVMLVGALLYYYNGKRKATTNTEETNTPDVEE